MSSVQFTVLGKPQPAGSKRAFAIRKAGQPTGRIAVIDDNPRAKSWQGSVAAAAHDAWPGPELMLGALMLEVDFYVARPAGHFGTGRNAGIVKAGAPAWPTTRPDATKLLRGVEDALTGLVWRDDAQITFQVATKSYGTPERAEITIRQEEP